MENKKVLIIGLLVLIIIAVITVLVVINLPKVHPEDTLNTYISYINDKNYEGMYDLLSTDSKSKINKEDFIKKNKNIYEGIDALDVKIDIKDTQKEDKKQKILYDQEMYTSAGKVNFSNDVSLVKENKE